MLVINEIYPAIQGEGKSAGKPVIFIRLSGCNLACVWCDTPFTWNWIGTKFVHPDKFDPRKESHKMDAHEVLAKLQEFSPKIHSVVISGGEPMLQQTALVELCTLLKFFHYWIEIETNGTKAPTAQLISVIDQFNCSPKLSNSGPDNPLKKREVPLALSALAALPITTFKFVITSDIDLEEVTTLIQKYDMKNVYLMPEGRTREEQVARQDKVRKMCERLGFHFSPRLHILEFGNKRGV
jgi:7-carboxy-7-deazaguanine synthase